MDFFVTFSCIIAKKPIESAQPFEVEIDFEYNNFIVSKTSKSRIHDQMDIQCL